MAPRDIDHFRRTYWQVVRELDPVRLGSWERSRLTFPQLRVLFWLRRAPGTTTRDLSRAFGLAISTVSGLVIKLVERGLVERTTDPDDRRQAPLRLTAAGAALAGELSEAGRPFLNQVAEELGDDLARVIAALDLLAAAADRARATLGEPETAEDDHARAGAAPVAAGGEHA